MEKELGNVKGFGRAVKLLDSEELRILMRCLADEKYFNRLVDDAISGEMDWLWNPPKAALVLAEIYHANVGAE